MADSADHDTVPSAPSESASSPPETNAAQCARYADIIVELGYSTRDRLDPVLRTVVESGGDAADFSSRVIESGLITREQSRACERALRGRSSIGGFSILEKVGQGGMGTVFRARQISMDRIVAVKILAPKFAQDPAFKQRFLNEARTCAKLSHLNIINGIDCGEDSGYTYFAMEFVEGRTIKQVLKEKKRLEPDEAFDIIRQISTALSYARKFDMVHRDIKPDNIMQTPAGVAKLCDLGLAMEAEHNESNNAVSTATPESSASKPSETDAKPAGKKDEHRLALGTPHYMSPEQARGEKNIDARSDIYSLGATFYHLLVGDTIFTGKSSTEVMTRHVVESAPNPCTLDPELPPGLGMIISKMMAKDPADRFANADMLIADLDAVKNGRLPEATGFNARTSCAILGDEALKRLRAGGVPTWRRLLPHVAAALVLGVIAYLTAINLGSKPVVIGQGPGPNPNTTVAPSTVLATTSTIPSPSPRPADTTKSNDDPPKPEVTTTKVAVTKVPLPPKVIEKPTVPDVVIEPPPPPPIIPVIPQLPRPEFKPTADILYARFLHEYEMRAGKKDMETAKLFSEMNDLSLSAAYAIAKPDIQAELADLKAGWEFEVKVLKKIVEQKGEIEFSPEVAKRWEVSKGKAVGFAETRGLQIEIKNGFAFYVAPSTLPVETILAKATDATPLAKVQFHYARGNRAGIMALKPLLSPTEAKRWDRKLDLMAVKEAELKAREEYKNLTLIAEAKSWKTFSEMVVDFQKDYVSTPTFKTNAAQIRLWQEAALRALEPPSKWRSVFHAVTVQDVLSSKGEALVELTYDFKTPDQVYDFSCAYGQLKIENGQLLVPPGGGDFSNVRFIAPFASIQSFSATGKTRQPELASLGIVFIEAAQMVTGPAATSPVLILDPMTKGALLANMLEGSPLTPKTPTVFDWRKETVFGFKTLKGEKHWTVDSQAIAVTKLPKQTTGGWIALCGANGNQAWTGFQIVFKPDPIWKSIRFKKKVEAPPAN
ncbi:MAG: protein kinase [Planctomycetota bacterium]